MSKAIILGSGGHAKVIASFIKQKYQEVLFFSAADEEALWKNPAKFRDHDFYLGVGDNDIRSRLFEKLNNLSFNLPVCSGPNSFIDDSAKLGKGVFIGAGAIILSSAVVEDNVIVNTLSSVDHDCIIKKNAQVTAGVCLGGATVVGEKSYLGIKAATLPGVQISKNVQIMAGSLVVKNCQENFVYGGNPARIIKSIEQAK